MEARLRSMFTLQAKIFAALASAGLHSCASDSAPPTRVTADPGTSVEIKLERSGGETLIVPTAGSGSHQQTASIAERMRTLRGELEQLCRIGRVTDRASCERLVEDARVMHFAAVDTLARGIEVMSTTSSGRLPVETTSALEPLLRAISSIASSSGQMRERVRTTVFDGPKGVGINYEYIAYGRKPTECTGQAEWRSYSPGAVLSIGSYYFRARREGAEARCCEAVAVWDDPTSISACFHLPAAR